MTSDVFAPLVPGLPVPGRSARAAAGRRRPLPMPSLPEPTADTAVCGVATIDSSGRIAEHTVFALLGWTAGTRLDIRVCGGLVLVHADQQAVFQVTRPGHLRLPAAARRRCDLGPGCRLLLIADPGTGLLVIHPPAAVAAMTAQYHTTVIGGGAA